MRLYIGILLLPAVLQLDLTGPYEVFASLLFRTLVHLVASSLDSVTSATGLILTPYCSFGRLPAPRRTVCSRGSGESLRWAAAA